MPGLRPGQNVPVPAVLHRARLDPAPTTTWWVEFDRDDAVVEISVVDGDVALDPANVADRVARVLLVAGGSQLPPLDVVVEALGAAPLLFHAVPPAGSDVALLVEFYRRDGGWKLRALGEGLPDVRSAETLWQHRLPAAGPVGAVPHPEHEQRNWVRIVQGIWEDAARSAHTFAEAQRFAAGQRDAELERLLADPRTRLHDHPARAAAEQRHADVVDRASTRRLAELDHLVAELDELERTLPAPLARWSSPAWTHLPATGSTAFRAGELTRADSLSLSVPVLRERAVAGGYLVLPWYPGSQERCRQLVWRMVAAGPPGAPPALLTTDAELAAAWGVPAPTGTVPEQLAELDRRLDLHRMAAEIGEPAPAGPASGLPSVVVIPLTGSADGPDAVQAIRRLAVHGPACGTSVLFLADHDARGRFGPGVPQSLLPVVPAQLDDPWVGLTWDVSPDEGALPGQVDHAIRARALGAG